MTSESLERRVFDVSRKLQKKAHIKSIEQYEEMYECSIEDHDGFWCEMADELLDWDRKLDKLLNEYMNHLNIALASCWYS